MPRFFVVKDMIKDGIITITGDDARHISSVLRMKKGDALTVCDGEGTDYEALVESAGKEVTARVTGSCRCQAEPEVKVTLFQALPKQGKMEYIIQKTTELGVSKIVPVYTKRCVVHPSDKRPSDKLERWRRVAYEAAKQCGRGIVPQVCETVSFEQAAGMTAAAEKKIMLYEEERETRLSGIIGNEKIREIAVMVGPEGGFDPEEAEYAASLGIQTVTLGRRILRTETAGAAAAAIIMNLTGDM